MHQVGRFVVEAEELGVGGYGAVFKAKDPSNGNGVACKVLSHSKMRLSAIQHEVKLMERLEHKHVIQLYEFIQLDSISYLFMELAAHGELFSLVIQQGNLDEPDARRFFAQIIDAVEYLHSNGIVHRDLKLENVLLDEHNNCKVCDFGLAHQYQCDENGKVVRTPLHDVCGSKSYAAPEVLAGRGYDGFAADVWSCGICLFAMLAGFFPLDGATASDWRFTRVVQAVAQGYSLTHTVFGFYSRPCVMSPEAAGLIDAMLGVHHASRASMANVRLSPWINGREKPSARAQSQLKDLNGVNQQFVEGPRYRSAQFVEIGANEAPLGLQMSVDLDVHALHATDPSVPAPVYRCAGMQEMRVPQLARQMAFGLPK